MIDSIIGRKIEYDHSINAKLILKENKNLCSIFNNISFISIHAFEIVTKWQIFTTSYLLCKSLQM